MRSFLPAFSALAAYALATAFASGMVLLAPVGARAQLSNAVYVSSGFDGSVLAYNATTGAQINTFNLSGLTQAEGLALSGNTLFVVDEDNDRIGSYNATTGAVINASLITGLNDPLGLTVLGSNLYVANATTVGKYQLNGTVVNASFISGLNNANGLASLQNTTNGTLYVANGGTNQLRAYDAVTGAATVPGPIGTGSFPFGVAATSNALYVANYVSDTVTAYSSSTGGALAGYSTPGSGQGINGPVGVAVQGNTLYVANAVTNRISTYNATTGASINTALITTGYTPNFILVTGAVMPEPASLALLGMGALPLVGMVIRRRKSKVA